MPARRTAGRASQVTCNADEGEPGTFKDRELLIPRLRSAARGCLLVRSMSVSDTEPEHVASKLDATRRVRAARADGGRYGAR